MLGGNPMVAMAAADIASQNPIILVIALCIGLCVILAPPCIICSCCCFIFRSLWMPDGDDDEQFTVGSQNGSKKYN
tara:strand:+ start:312 stop:539 length:228 start_codon:yes stop_codon:yes gene_type:complete